MVVLTRRFRFPAAHVLAQPAYSRAENLRIYGKCANPAGHGHDYEVEVSVTGPIDPESGRIAVGCGGERSGHAAPRSTAAVALPASRA